MRGTLPGFRKSTVTRSSFGEARPIFPLRRPVFKVVGISNGPGAGTEPYRQANGPRTKKKDLSSLRHDPDRCR